MASEKASLRLQLKRAGYPPIACEGKAVHIKGWQLKYDANDGEIELWDKVFPRADNTGILTRTTPTFDIDILDEAAARAVEELVRTHYEEHGRILVRTGKAPKRAIPFRTDTPFPKIIRNFTAPNGDLHKIEFLCDGQQFVAFGEHPDTHQPYRWHGGDPRTVLREELPYISSDDALALVDNVVELLTREHGYTVSAFAKGNGKDEDGEHGHTDWSSLLEKIISGKDFHGSSVSMAADLIKSGMSNGAVINLLRGAFMLCTTKDARWQERYDDIPRAVKTARGKFGASRAML
jgi:Bifunctional DNA primase/polymerase, N-terminal